MRNPRAAQLLRQLLLSPGSAADSVYASCVERGALCTALVGSSPQLAEQLFSRADEPGAWTALVLLDEDVVLSATWQELISGANAKVGLSVGRRSERRH
jgi:hypothetical protein